MRYDMSEDKLLKKLTESYMEMKGNPVESSLSEDKSFQDQLRVKLGDIVPHNSDLEHYMSGFEDVEDAENVADVTLDVIEILSPEEINYMVSGQVYIGDTSIPSDVKGFVEYIKQSIEDEEWERHEDIKEFWKKTNVFDVMEWATKEFSKYDHKLLATFNDVLDEYRSQEEANSRPYHVKRRL